MRTEDMKTLEGTIKGDDKNLSRMLQNKGKEIKTSSGKRVE